MKINLNKNEIEYIEKNVKATLEIEGLKPSKSGKKITREFLKGKISSREAIQKIKDNYFLLLIDLNVSNMKINQKFGQNLYFSFKDLLFYGVAIACVVALIKSLLQDKIRICTLIAQIFISAIVLFIAYNPINLLDLGKYLYDLMFDVAKSAQVEN